MSSQSSIGDSDKENSTPNTLRTLQEITKSKKRVLFSPLPALLQPSVDSKPDYSRLPQKSVLKVGHSSSSPFSSPLYEKADPATSDLDYMIESSIQSLAGNDRPCKIETYATLSNLFRTFENIPDRTKLFPRLAELFGLIVADVMRPSEEDAQQPDYPLNTKALKVAGFLLFDKQISAAVPNQLARNLIEHSLRRMEAEKVTKATSTQFLWLWQTQHLPRACITTEIAERILLATVKAEFPSLIINQERMSVFFRLLDQSREAMVKNVELWLPRVINYLLDDNKQIRTAALRMALEAGKHLCRVPQVGRCVQNHLKSEVQGKPYIEVSSERFKTIMQEPEGGIYIAHAWGSICTLSSSQNPEKSKTLMAWMHVLQIVFNSPATENKIMAQSAWVRMIHYFGNNGDIVYREKNLAYLTKPICRMLSPDVKVYDTVRMAAINTACSLLYTLNRPSASFDQTNVVWSEVIEPVFKSMLQDYQKVPLQQKAVDILGSLFEVKTIEPWSLNRLLEDKTITEKDLQHLDARWLRAQIHKIAPLLTLALQSSASRMTKAQLWSNVQKSLRSASAKEIQISAETMDATASICGIYKALWTAPLPVIGSPSNKVQEDVSQRVSFISELILITFEHFGTSSFTEKTLSFADGGEIVPSQTPSISRDSNSSGHGTGLKFVFDLFQKPAHEIMVGPDYIDMLESISTRCLANQKSLRKCMILLNHCMSCITIEKSKLSVQSWKILAEIAHTQIQAENKRFALQSPSRSKAMDFEEYWQVARSILETGIRLQHGPAFPEWLLLLESLTTAIQAQADAHAGNLYVVEPLSKLLLGLGCTQIEYVETLLTLARFDPGKVVSAAEPDRKSAKHDMLDVPSLPKLASSALLHMETKWKRYHLSEEALSFLQAVAEFLDRLDSRQADEAVRSISEGVVKWVGRVDEGADVMLLSFLGVVGRIASVQPTLLPACEPVFIASLSSKHARVVEQGVVTWNTTFGNAHRLDYSPEFVAMVKKADLSAGLLRLPTWPEQDPEVTEAPSSSSKMVLAPPKMQILTEDETMVEPRDRSRSRSASRSNSRARKVTKGFVSEEQVSPAKAVSKKRKRRNTGSIIAPGDHSPEKARTTTSTDTSTADVVPKHDDVEKVSESARKRQKRSNSSAEKLSPAKSSRRATRASASESDDVFGAQSSATFTLRKRDLRAMSPQIQSDPISESSPSVYSRVRKLSTSTEPPIMQDLRLASRSLSPSVRDQPIIHQDEEEFEMPERQSDVIVVNDVPRIALRPPNSDDLMQLQIQDIEPARTAPDQSMDELRESIDEDLFIIQLQQYRESLKEGRPITPRRRRTLGILMKEITKLSGDVAEMYFNA